MKTSYTIARLLPLVSVITGLLNTGYVTVSSSSGDAEKAPAVRYDVTKVKHSYSKIPLSFEANHGQADKNVKFTSRGSGYSLALAPTTFTVAVANPRSNTKEDVRVQSRASVLRATLLGGNAAANLTGLEHLGTRTNYLIGSDPRQWKTNSNFFQCRVDS